MRVVAHKDDGQARRCGDAAGSRAMSAIVGIEQCMGQLPGAL